MLLPVSHNLAHVLTQPLSYITNYEAMKFFVAMFVADDT